MPRRVVSWPPLTGRQSHYSGPTHGHDAEEWAWQQRIRINRNGPEVRRFCLSGRGAAMFWLWLLDGVNYNAIALKPAIANEYATVF